MLNMINNVIDLSELNFIFNNENVNFENILYNIEL